MRYSWHLQLFLSFCCSLFCAAIAVPATAYAQVVISEVYAAPTTGESEWIELYNAGSSSVTLEGWTLFDQLSSPSELTTFTTVTLVPGEFFVFTLSTAKLNNAADGVSLYDDSGTVQDAVQYQNAVAGQSWQRTHLTNTEVVLTTPTPGIDSPNYSLTPTPASVPQTTATPAPSATPATPAPTGTPQSSPDPTPASTGVPTPTPSPVSSSTPSPTPSLSPSPSPNPSGTPTPLPSPHTSPSPSPAPTALDLMLVHLSEIAACPSSGSEWLELYNSGSSPVSIQNWRVTDDSGTSKTISGSLPAGGYEIFSWSGSLLNNAGDSLTLTTASGQQLTTIEYTSCTTGLSLVYAPTTDGYDWTATEPTPRAANATPTTTTTATHTGTTTLGSHHLTGSSALGTSTDGRLVTDPQSIRDDRTQTRTIPTLDSIGTDMLKRAQQAFQLPDFTIHPTSNSTPPTPKTLILPAAVPPKKPIIGGILSSVLSFGSSLILQYVKKNSLSLSPLV